MKWIKPPLAEESVRSLAENCNMDLLTASILTRRNVTEPGELAFFLEDDERFLHNPMLFPDMEKAVERVLEAVAEGEKILICGDKDADGITSVSLLVETLRNLGLDPDWRVPIGEEDYGLNPGIIKKAAGEDVTLLITVDCGISDFDEVKLAADLGMDVLIFDHHMPQNDQLPAAHAIINPKIPDSYPFPNLCAVAVASKFQWALSLAGTELWGRDFCILLARSDSDKLTLEASKIRNLTETAYLRVETDSGEAERENFLRFIEGTPLLTYDSGKQVPLISAFFGGADVHVIDSSPLIAEIFPAARGRSLEELGRGSRMARYFSGHDGLLFALRNLIITAQYRKILPSFDPWRRCLDLAALGTLADMMPMKGENRILVKMGLARLNGNDKLKERRVAIRELLIRQRLHEGLLDAGEVGWNVTPLLNAAGRMGRADVAVHLFLESDPVKIASIADELIEMNKQRRALSAEFWEKLYPVACESKSALNERMSIVSDTKIPRGITGILATRLHRALAVPSVVISAKNEEASGSIRCGHGMDAMEWLSEMAPLFSDFGGHPQAGGFRLKREGIARLEEKTLEWFKGQSQKEPINDILTVDAELPHREIVRLGEEGIENVVKRLEPYGEGFKSLVFLTRSVTVLQAALIGKPDNNHLKLLVSFGDWQWPALWWDGAKHYGPIVKEGEQVDLIYQIDRDRWRGTEARRLTVLGATPCRA